jgi:heat shock protein HspQ
MNRHEKLNANARYPIGQPVKHRIFGFRGVIFDVDPEFNNTEEWYQSIPEHMRPAKNQPFYHLFAEDSDHAPYIAYVSEQNLVTEEDEEEPIHHPEMDVYFEGRKGDGRYILRQKAN